MATRGPRSQAPVNTLLSAGISPEQMAQLSPAQRAQLLKRMKGAMPANVASAPPAPGAGPNTIFS